MILVRCPNRCGEGRHEYGSGRYTACLNASQRTDKQGPSKRVIPPPSLSVGRKTARAESYATRHASLRSWLDERKYTRALEAMEYAEGFHTGIRKDGVTPEFEHQVSIATYLSTLTPSLRKPETTLVVSFLHDVPEDYGVAISEIESHFGSEAAESTYALSKSVDGVDRDPEEVFMDQAESPIASPVKGGDRIHNHSTMGGVFTPEKIEDYLNETETYILPMLKLARRLHPDQDLVYQNERSVLRTQIEIFRRLALAQG